MLKYPATRKEGIVYFIYKVTLLLSMDANKEIMHEVIKQYISKVSIIYTHYMLYLYIL